MGETIRVFDQEFYFPPGGGMMSEQLFNRMKKVGEDQNTTMQMAWGKDENTDADVFGIAIAGYGHTCSFDGPRREWELTLTKALDYWDDIKNQDVPRP